MKGFTIFLIVMAIALHSILATNKGYRSSFKPLTPPAPAYTYPAPAYAFPPAPIAPAVPAATTYRYDVRYNPYKYAYGPPALPAAPVPAAPIPVPAGYVSPYAPVPAYGPVEVPAAPAYWPAYPSPHAQHFFDRHYAHSHGHGPGHAHGHHHHHH